MKKRVGILTSGGDCPGLNATIRGVAKALYQRFGEDVTIVGISNGFSGLINGEWREMKPYEFSGILTVGGTILGTKRTPFKLMRVVGEDDVDKVAEMKKNYAAIENRAKQGKHFSILAVAEGVYDVKESRMKKKERLAKRKEEGITTATNRIARQIEEMTGFETRTCVPGHTQRGGSPSPYDRVLATQFGSYAAKMVEDGNFGITVAMKNNHVGENKLADIAGKSRLVPDGHGMLEVARRMGISLG